MADQKLPTRAEDFSDWYNQLVLRAELADYAPVKTGGKLKSDRAALVIEMRPTPKIADRIHAMHPELPMIMFKLESGITREELHARARETARRAGARAIVANLLQDVSAGAHRADLLSDAGRCVTFETREEIASGLVSEVERLVRSSMIAETR